PARVERDALADERDALLTTARGRVREVDELRRLGASGRHAEERAHPHAAALGAVVDLDREPALLGDLRGGAGEVARAQLVRRSAPAAPRRTTPSVVAARRPSPTTTTRRLPAWTCITCPAFALNLSASSAALMCPAAPRSRRASASGSFVSSA